MWAVADVVNPLAGDGFAEADWGIRSLVARLGMVSIARILVSTEYLLNAKQVFLTETRLKRPW